MSFESLPPAESKAPFNMAISTLESLRYLLDEISKTDRSPLLSEAGKQNLKIKSVKRFYTNSSPLLDEDTVKKFKQILEIKSPKHIMLKNGIATGEETLRFDFELDVQLDQYLIDIQRELQSKGYFMPPRKDKGRAVAEF